MESEKKNIFSDEEIKNFAGLFDVLERVNRRLMREGFKMVDGELIPPPDYKPRKK